MRSVKQFLALAAIFFSAQLMAQSITVCGYVTDLNGSGISNQTVYLEDSLSMSTATAVTDSLGYYCATLSTGPGGSQGMVLGYTQDCNGSYQYQVAFYSPAQSSVTLNFSICTGTSTTCSAYIQGNPTPMGQWQFTAYSTVGTPPFTYSWTVSNGTTYSTQSIMLNNLPTGYYTVCVGVTDANGCYTAACDSLVISASTCSASYTYSTTSVSNQVQFTSSTTGTAPFTYEWAFGDGDSAFVANPIHQYNSAGGYGCTLIVTDSTGCVATYFDTVYPGPVPCSAWAQQNVNGLTANFNGYFYGVPPMTYAWDFGDGNGSSLKNPSHTYSTAGTYTVSMIGTDSYGCTDTVSLTTVVTGTGGGTTCMASFVVIPDTAAIAQGNLTFDFVDLSTGSPSSWQWSFGDGSSSSLQSPSHTYSSLGTYVVMLTISDSANGCFSAALDSLVIDSSFTLAPIVVNFTYTNLGNNTVMFTNLSGLVQGNFDYHWDFGDGTTSTIENPTHHYAAEGTYNVCLLVTGLDGMTYRDCNDEVEALSSIGIVEWEDRISSPYPNPASNTIFLNVDQGIDIQNIQLTDVQGRHIDVRWEKQDGRVQLDVPAHPHGLYLIHMRSGDKTWSRRVILE